MLHFRSKQILSVVVSLTFAALSLLPVTWASDNQDRLLETIFTMRKYNRLTRPVTHFSDTVAVSIGTSIRQIIEVDERNERLIASIWRKQEWYDYRFIWNASDFGGVDSIRIPPSQIWIPDLVLYNSIEFGEKEEDAFLVLIGNDGLCSYYPLEISVTQCTIDIRDFPFDDQHCTLEFESWSFDVTQLNLTLNALAQESGLDVRWLKRSTAWEVLDSPVERIEKIYDSAPYPYISVVFSINLRRKVLFYVVNLIVPCALIASLTCLAFLLPIGDRIGLGLTTLLALSVYQIIILDRIPASSEGIPVIGVYFITQISANAIAIIFMVFTGWLHQKAEQEPPPTSDSCKELVAACQLSKNDEHQALQPHSRSFTNEVPSPNTIPSLSQLNNFKSDKGYEQEPTPTDVIRLAHLLEVLMSQSGTSAPDEKESVSAADFAEVKVERGGREAPDTKRMTNWKLIATRVDRACFVLYAIGQFILLFFIMSYGKRA